jgi:hypothetical protein
MDNTVERLKLIRERFDKLPDDPWFLSTDENGDEWISIPGHSLFYGNIEETDKCCYDIAEFIFNSKSDVKYLLDLVRKLQEAVFVLSIGGKL